MLDVIVVTIPIAVQVEKMRRRDAEDKRMKKTAVPNSIQDLPLPMQIMACLIASVYQRDRKHDIKAKEYYAGVGYTPIDEHVIGLDTTTRMILFQRTRRRDRRMLPMYVVAIRGTILDKHDISADFKIVTETLHVETQLFDQAKKIVIEIYHKCCRRDGADCEVQVAGHSLGATLALYAARELALGASAIVIKTHLYNLPSCSLDVIAEKLFTGYVNGVGDVVGKVFGNRGNKFVRKTGALIQTTAKNIIQGTVNLFDESHLISMESDCNTLLERRFAPLLYVNPNDPACNKYVQGGVGKSNCSTWTATLAQRLGVNARSYQLIPAANVIVNHWGEGPFAAHSLDQWFLYGPSRLEEHPPNFVRRTYPGSTSGGR